MSDIRKQVERSSLGTANARAARQSISTEAASKVVARAAALTKQSSAPRIRPRKTGG